MLEFMFGFFLAESATFGDAEISLIKLLVFTAIVALGVGLLALNAHISPDGDVKNTISVIKNRLKSFSRKER